MGRQLKAQAIVLAALLSPPTTSNAFLTGNELREWCAGRSTEKAFCFGFVDGTLEGAMIQWGKLGTDPKKAPYCLPEGVTREQIVHVITRHINSIPEERHQPAAHLALRAVAGAFPCR